MKEFESYHPIVNFIYFVFIIAFSCFLMHPICLIISFSSGIFYRIMLKGTEVKKISYFLFIIVFTSLINPLFNHQGITILGYLPDGNPITLESVVYGIFASVMIVSVILWFSCFNFIMTSDKFIYLFGKALPSLSLIFSMTLRFVPRFKTQLKIVANANKCIGKDPGRGNIIRRAKNGLSILSVMTTWALENSIETADSMKSRGYGLRNRTAYSNYKFTKRDCVVLILTIMLGIHTLAGKINGAMDFVYFPMIKTGSGSIYSISVFIFYFVLCIFPIIIELWEVRRWKSIK